MMPLYEGITLIQEKQAVVLDLGTDYTKFGFTGEAAPRCIIKSEFWCPAERRYKRVHEYKTPEELYENLVHMLHLLYFRHVLVNPKERKVVVVESLLTPTLFRETLAKVLFLHYEVSGVVWADAPRLCALTLGTQYALVINLGAKEAEVCAVVHSIPILKALQAQPLGSHTLHENLATMLDQDNGKQLNLAAHIIEDIKVKTCFVTTRARSLAWSSSTPPKPAPQVRYPIKAGAPILVSGKTRELAAEYMFEKDNEMSSLADIVLQCIIMCPIDARVPLAENILVCGGHANLPGLTARLAEELRYLLEQPPYSERLSIRTVKFHTPCCPPGTVGWAGGAVLGATADRGWGRDLYLQHPAVADWVSLTHRINHE